MLPHDKPFTSKATQKEATSRSTGECEGWVFHHADVSLPRWAMTDKITYRLPDHTEEYPKLHMETLQTAISEAYYVNWERHSRMANRNKKDQDADKPLYRGNCKSYRQPMFIYVFSYRYTFSSSDTTLQISVLIAVLDEKNFRLSSEQL